MSHPSRESIYEAIASIRLIDPHTHINPHSAGSTTLADLLGYHYYTELAHSAGMPKSQIEQPGLQPRELVGRLVANLGPLENTAQYRWLVEICRMFFGFDGDRIDASNWESLYDAAESQMASAEWPQMVLDQSNVEAVFLTNDFDDELSGFDTDTYIPCLRTDDLVFHLSKPEVRERLIACSGVELDGSLASLRAALRQRFDHFTRSGARACAISIPPTFSPSPVSDGRAATALDQLLRQGISADDSHKSAMSRRVFWTLAELCDEFGLPFDLMIGVNRGVYADGVYQGQDLYDSRVSLTQYRELFNAFPDVKFPVSVLASVTNQELVSHAWIFPNVITNGHWWYSNTPSFIARDARARLEAVPQTKQIGYYSDAYKLEFVWPKFDMYRRVLSGVLADHFVGENGWSEERAIELGRRVLRDNVDEIFPRPAGMVTGDDGKEDGGGKVDSMAETWSEDLGAVAAATAGVSAMSETIAMESETISIDDELSDDLDLDLDPLPSDDEIQTADVIDVELADAPEPRSIEESDIDPEPLDVGDIFGDDDDEKPEIQMLRGEDSFEADDDSLLLTPDPTTGELTFQATEDEDIVVEEGDDFDLTNMFEDEDK